MPDRQLANHVEPAPLQRVEPSCFETRPAVPARRETNDLHICPTCASELVYPVDWEPAPERRWSVHLRCPDCEWTGGGVYEQSVVDRFDEVLDLGTESIVEDLRLLARANMEEQIDRFVGALEADLVLPEDF